MIMASMFRGGQRLVDRTRPHLAPLEGYDPLRHRREAIIFTRWALEIGLRHSRWAPPVRMVQKGLMQLLWQTACLRGQVSSRDFRTRRRDALSTIWNSNLYTEDGVTLAPTTVTPRTARLFAANVTGQTNPGGCEALADTLWAHFVWLVMPLQPEMQPKPAWMRAL